jgi:hypothetical protein
MSAELRTASGVFGAQRIDRGTLVLLRTAPAPAARTGVLDLGTGYGPIAVTMAHRTPTAGIWAVDVNQRALALTRTNAAATEAGNVFAVQPHEIPAELRFDRVYRNPPIKIGKDELRLLLRDWLGRLVGGADAWLVVKQSMGADSLRSWLVGAGFPTVRAASKQGYRLLRASTPAGRGRPGGRLTAADLAIITDQTGRPWRVLGHLTGGFADPVQLLGAGRHRAVVKIKQGDWWGGQLDRLLGVVDELRAAGYPTRPVIGHGNLGGDRHYLMTEFAPGQAIGRLTPAAVDDLLDAVAAQARVHPPRQRDWSAMITLFLNGGIAEFEFHPSVLALARQAIGLVSHPVPALPTGDFVHGDFSTRNTVFQDGRLASIIDIEGFGSGTRTIDLVALLPAALDGREGDPALAERIAWAAIAASGSEVFLACVAHRVLAALSWATEHPELLPGAAGRADALLGLLRRLGY